MPIVMGVTIPRWPAKDLLKGYTLNLDASFEHNDHGWAALSQAVTCRAILNSGIHELHWGEVLTRPSNRIRKVLALSRIFSWLRGIKVCLWFTSNTSKIYSSISG